MVKIMNPQMAGKASVTAFGILEFDAHGAVEVPEEQAVLLLELEGYESADGSFEPEIIENGEESEEVETTSTEEEPTQEIDENASNDDEKVDPNEEGKLDESDEEVETDENGEESEEVETLEDKFEGMNVPQLKKYAKDHNIDLKGAAKKDEITAILIGAEKN